MTAFVSDERGPRRDAAVADSPVDVAKLLAVRLGM
jgi:hypothetical protein